MKMSHGDYRFQLLNFTLVFSLSLFFFKCVFLFPHYKLNLPIGSKLECLESSLIPFPWSFAWGVIRCEMGCGIRVKHEIWNPIACVRMLAPLLPSQVSLEKSATTGKHQLPRL